MIKKILKPVKQGFTLFEVMIALAILSIAMIAGLVTTSTVLERTVYVERKILGHWVGMNILNKLQLKMLKEELDVIKSSGIENLRGIDFNWDLTIEKIKLVDEDILDVKVDIYEQNGEAKYSLDTVTRKIPIL